MGIELDLFCLDANYPRSDRLRSSAPSDSFASALPGWSFYLEDLCWGKVGLGGEPLLSRPFALGLGGSWCKSLWNQELWTERRVHLQPAPCGVQVRCVSLSIGSNLSRVSCKGEGALPAYLPLSLMIWNVPKAPAAKVASSQEKPCFH